MPRPTLETHPSAHDRLKRAIARARRRALAPPPRMTVDEWADTYRVVPSETSPTPGPWRTSRYEVARGPMRWMTAPGTHQVSLMACVQIAKTSCAENLIGRTVHLAPVPIILAQADEGEAHKFSKRKLDPMIESTPVLKRLMGRQGKRDPSQTLQERTFPGGSLQLVQASTAEQSFSMTPAAIVILDEVDKWRSKSAKDPIEMARRRTMRFSEAGQDLVVAVCSPSDAGTSTIEALFNAGDQRRPFLPCPHCGTWQVLEWGGRDSDHGVKWDRGEDGQHLPDTARYRCTCGLDWTEAERKAALQRIQWRQTKPFTCCGVEQTPEAWDWVERDGVGYALCGCCGRRAVDHRHASGHISRLYDPRPLAELVRTWINAQGNPAALAEFYREDLAIPFEAEARALAPGSLLARAESRAADIPDQVAVLTAGVDVQDDRLEVEVVGWGAGEESWGVQYVRIPGDTNTAAPWLELERLLSTPVTRADGRRLVVQAAAIDSGHRAQVVVDFCRRHLARRWWPVKGSSWDLTRPKPIWPEDPQRWRSGKPVPFELGGQAARSTVMGRWRLEGIGPGVCHIPAGRGYDDDWAEQVAGGYRRVHKRLAGGRTVAAWEDSSRTRCEALDCRVYATAALYGLYRGAGGLDHRVTMAGWIRASGAAIRDPDAPADEAPAPAPKRELPPAPHPVVQAPPPAPRPTLPAQPVVRSPFVRGLRPRF